VYENAFLSEKFNPKGGIVISMIGDHFPAPSTIVTHHCREENMADVA
jgi:hypothetical protein